MNTKTMFLGAVTLLAGAAFLLPQVATAYKGDPQVKGLNYTPERHQAMTQALAESDYEAWKALMNGKGVANRINRENFARFAQAHALALQGRTDEAAAIRAQLGLGQHNGSGMGQGNGQGRMNR